MYLFLKIYFMMVCEIKEAYILNYTFTITVLLSDLLEYI